MGGSRGKGRPFFHVDDILQLNWPAQVILNTSASFFHGVSMETETENRLMDMAMESGRRGWDAWRE